jgi:hypothetical protein
LFHCYKNLFFSLSVYFYISINIKFNFFFHFLLLFLGLRWKHFYGWKCVRPKSSKATHYNLKILENGITFIQNKRVVSWKLIFLFAFYWPNLLLSPFCHLTWSNQICEEMYKIWNAFLKDSKVVMFGS